MEINVKKINLYSEKMALWAVALLFLSAPVSRALFYISAGFIILGWLFSGNWYQKWFRLRNNTTSFVFLLLVIWIAMSSLWSQGSTETVTIALKRQWALILIPIIATLNVSSSEIRRYWYSFAIGMIILLIHIFLVQQFNIPWVNEVNPTRVFYNPLPQSIGLSLFALWCLNELSLSYNKKRIKKIILFMLLLSSIYVVFYINQQRSAYLTFVAGLFLLVSLRFSKKIRWIYLLFVATLLVTVVMLNPTVNKRIDLAKYEITQYYTQGYYYSSVGARLHMWNTSLKAVSEAPIIGRGLGSYTKVIEEKFQDSRMCSYGCTHPHNQFILFLFEYGVIGLSLFLFGLVLALWLCIKEKVIMPFIVLVVFIVASLTDSTLWYRGYIYLFVPLFSISFLFNDKQNKRGGDFWK